MPAFVGSSAEVISSAATSSVRIGARARGQVVPLRPAGASAERGNIGATPLLLQPLVDDELEERRAGNVTHGRRRIEFVLPHAEQRWAEIRERSTAFDELGQAQIPVAD